MPTKPLLVTLTPLITIAVCATLTGALVFLIHPVVRSRSVGPIALFFGMLSGILLHRFLLARQGEDTPDRLPWWVVFFASLSATLGGLIAMDLVE